MIDALIAGKLYGQPMERTGKSGKPFVTAKERVTAGDGESLFVNAIPFNQAPCALRWLNFRTGCASSAARKA